MMKITMPIRLSPNTKILINQRAKSEEMTMSALVEKLLLQELGNSAEAESESAKVKYIEPNYYWLLYNPAHPLPEIEKVDFGKSVRVEDWGLHQSFKKITVGDRVLLYGGTGAGRGVIGCGVIIKEPFVRMRQGDTEESWAITVQFEHLIDPENDERYLKRAEMLDDPRWSDHHKCPGQLIQCNGFPISLEDARHIEERFRLKATLKASVKESKQNPAVGR
jgi:hypothetical protein